MDEGTCPLGSLIMQLYLRERACRGLEAQGAAGLGAGKGLSSLAGCGPGQQCLQAQISCWRGAYSLLTMARSLPPSETSHGVFTPGLASGQAPRKGGDGGKCDRLGWANPSLPAAGAGGGPGAAEASPVRGRDGGSWRLRARGKTTSALFLQITENTWLGLSPLEGFSPALLSIPGACSPLGRTGTIRVFPNADVLHPNPNPEAPRRGVHGPLLLVLHGKALGLPQPALLRPPRAVGPLLRRR